MSESGYDRRGGGGDGYGYDRRGGGDGYDRRGGGDGYDRRGGGDGYDRRGGGDGYDRRGGGDGYDRRGGGGYNDRRGGGWDGGKGYGKGRSGGRDDDGDDGGGGARPVGTGRIAILKDGFGFIEPEEGTGQHYFHFSSLRDAAQPRLGDEVRYVLEVDRRSGREAAARMSILPPGTLPPRAEVQLQGVIERAGREGGKIVLGTTLSPDAGDGEAQGHQRTVYHYEPREAPRSGPPLTDGDLVEFTITEGRPEMRGGKKWCRKVVLIKAGGGLPRHQGAVITVKEHFGFIRQADAPGECFFHFSELPREAQADVRPGVEVEYCKTKDARSGKEAATRITLLPEGSVSFEVILPPRYEGVVGTAIGPLTSQRALPAAVSRSEKLSQGGVLRASVASVASDAAAVAPAAEPPAAAPASSSDGGGAGGGDGGGEDGSAGGGGGGAAASASRGACSSWADASSDDEEGGSSGEGGGKGRGGKGRGGMGRGSAGRGSSAGAAAVAAEAEDAVAGADAAEAAALERALQSLSNVPAERLRPPQNNERLGFSVADLMEGTREEGVFDGDTVEFSLAVEKNGGARGAANVRVLVPNWQRGFVVHTKDDHGFIKPALSERGGQVYFSKGALSEAVGQLRSGEELEFRTFTEAGGGGGGRDGGGKGGHREPQRICAAMIRRLPKGTIITEWLLPEWWLATVSRPARGRGQQHGKGQGKGGAQADGHGVLTVSRLMAHADEPLEDAAAAAAAAADAAADAATDAAGGVPAPRRPPPPTTADVGQAILDVNAPLVEGDAGRAVSSAMAEGAADGSAATPAAPNAPTGRALAAIARLRGVAPPAAAAAEAASAETNARQRGGGSRRLVTEALKAAIAPTPPPPPADGTISATAPAAAAAEATTAPVAAAPGALPFTLDDLSDARTSLGAGDHVGVQLCVHASSGKLRVARVRLVAAAVEERERGVATAIKDHFGFLRCESREGQLFFHFAALTSGGGGGGGGGGRPPHNPSPGDEFDFGARSCHPPRMHAHPTSQGVMGALTPPQTGGLTRPHAASPRACPFPVPAVVGVDERTGKQSALKMRSLPRGSVKFEETVSEGLSGYVGSVNLGNQTGEVVSDTPYEGSTLRLPLSRNAVTLPRGSLPALGSDVTFDIGRLKSKGTLVATNVK